jgi:hypothetical protein
MSVAKSFFGNKIRYASSTFECIKDVDACIIVTEWEEFKKLTPEDFTKNMKQPILIDGRRIFNPQIFKEKMRFVALGFGKQSKIKDITTELVIEGKVDVITRSDAMLANKEIYSDDGKANELLYYIQEEDDLD